MPDTYYKLKKYVLNKRMNEYIHEIVFEVFFLLQGEP